MIHKETKKYGQFVILMFLFIIIFQFTSYASEMITYNKNNYFNIVIPKEITINAETESANYYIKANGNILDTQMLSIVPDTNFLMQENGGKNDINGIVTQNNFDYYYNNLQGEGTEYNGNIQIYNLSAGEWSGKFNFNISVNVHEHSYKFISETEATCTEDGYKKYECEVCEYIHKEKTVNATGHNYTSEHTNGTETKKGYTTYTCVDCGHYYIVEDEDSNNNNENNENNNEETEHIHTYTSQITTEATCTNNGLKTYTCSGCNDTYTEEILAIGHNYIGTLTKEATETENGEMTYTCSQCGDSYTEVIPIKELPTKVAFNDMSWADISTVSEAGEAANYFNIGDEKELTIGSETYHVQILGFGHDDKSDGTGKAGITVGLKEVMTTNKPMNDTATNTGGWKDCEMRTYLNETVHNSLPSDLQAVIKTVNKKSDNGNMNTTILNTTEDKLFLLSLEEVGFTTSDVYGYNVVEQGTKYEYFTDNASRVKSYLSGSIADYWWLRSADAEYTYCFLTVNNDGDCDNFFANDSYGVVFGFSI